jgi:DNA (cytosine-5)-methyltransferase 1
MTQGRIERGRFALELALSDPHGPKASDCADSPETFGLAADRQAIERTIRRRDGSAYTTRLPLDKPAPRRPFSNRELAALADATYLRSPHWRASREVGRTLRLVDLFSGCGVMTLGAWEACRAIGYRLKPILALDMNPSALKVYKRNFPQVQTRSNRIEELLDGHFGQPATDSETAFLEKLGRIDILVGGPPCQGHSDLNNYTRRADPKNKLYERMARFAELVRPKHIVIENVSAVLHDRGQIVEKTATLLGRLGYELDEIVAEVSALGVAQRRRRHVLVASIARRPDLARTLAHYARSERSVGWAIEDLRKSYGTSHFDTASKPGITNQSRIEYLFQKDQYDLPNEMRPDCHRLKDHSYKSVYGRMFWDRPAQTITSGFTCMGQGRYVHPKSKRTITPHEAARLQFIPDFFRFGEDLRRTDLAEMIGNAVPSKLTYVLLLEQLR